MLMEAIHDLSLGTHVNTHNLTIVLASLMVRLPFGSIFFEANLTSGLAGAFTIALLYGVLYRMTSSAVAAAVTASGSDTGATPSARVSSTDRPPASGPDGSVVRV